MEKNMCGRYYIDEEMTAEIQKVVREIDRELRLPKSGDVHPAERALVLAGSQVGHRVQAKAMRWGFLRYDHKGLLINARAETVLERTAFRDSAMQRRCVIPARWFYEWNREKEKAIFLREDAPVLYMAGIYRRFEAEDRFVILTTQANASVAPVHDRMPLVLEKRELEDWVYEESFMRYALQRTPVLLKQRQEYEQQSLPLF